MIRLPFLLVMGAVCGCASAPTQPSTTCPQNAAQNQSGQTATFGIQTPMAVARPAVPKDTASAPLDPTVTDGDKYHAILDNDHVRVLSYRDKPGEKTHPHHHAEFVLYALSSFRRRLIFPDGTFKERDFKPGDAIWMPEQDHVGENTGTTDTDVVIVEFKSH